MARLERAVLLSRDGLGPWSQGQGFHQDFTKNWEVHEEMIPIIPPNPNGKTIVDRFFYRVNDCVTYYCGQPINFDFFATKEALTHKELYSPKPSILLELRLREIDVDRQISRDAPNYTLTVNLDRIRFHGEEDNPDSLDAITVLHNVAKVRKIAFVCADGGVVESRWVLFDYDDIFVPVDDVVDVLSGLQYEAGNPVYGALYFNACNPESMDINMYPRGKDLPIPVVIHTEVNDAIISAAKVFLPEDRPQSLYIRGVKSNL